MPTITIKGETLSFIVTEGAIETRDRFKTIKITKTANRLERDAEFDNVKRWHKIDLRERVRQLMIRTGATNEQLKRMLNGAPA